MRKRDRAIIDEAIARVGLTERADSTLQTLSGGLQQRAFIAKALAAEPSLLVLDEPTAGVDVEAQEALAALLARLHQELGTTILYVSHEFGAVERYVERLLLVRGTIAFDGPPTRSAGRLARPLARACLTVEFMRLAFAAGAVIGVLAPAVGFFLVQRRMSLIGDGIGHVAFAGVAAGLLLNVSPIWTALVAAVVGGVAIEWLRAQRHAAGDQALALVFYTGIAGGVVLVSLAGSLNVNLFQYLFGSILTVTREDVVVVAILGVAGLVTIALLYRALCAVVLDEEGARVAGVPVAALNVAVAALAAVTVALSMRIVGVLLIAALMVLPVSAAMPLAWSMRSAFLLSIATGLASVLCGLTLSYYADLPPGGTTVLAAAAVVLTTTIAGAVRRA